MSANRPKEDPDSDLVAWASAVLERERVRMSAERRSETAAVMVAMNALCARLGVQLRRWLGVAGWHSFLSRAVADARAQFSEERLFVVGPNGELHCAEGTRPAAARAASVAVLTAAAFSLERFIGLALARQIMERAFAAPTEGLQS